MEKKNIAVKMNVNKGLSSELQFSFSFFLDFVSNHTQHYNTNIVSYLLKSDLDKTPVSYSVVREDCGIHKNVFECFPGVFHRIKTVKKILLFPQIYN